ncbi:MAG: hypothetical protein K0S29_1320 [Gammaproteobacteria bacterium]|nr:hypothetical protein [Gammaproteobacteria bacterium]
MKLKQLLIYLISALSLSGSVFAANNSSVSNNVQTVLQTCQCPNCDLSKANLSGFEPGNGAAIEQYAFGKDYGVAPSVTCNFSSANFKQVDLSNSNFITQDVPGGSMLKQVTFTAANFTQANLSNSQFSYANFSSQLIFLMQT